MADSKKIDQGVSNDGNAPIEVTSNNTSTTKSQKAPETTEKAAKAGKRSSKKLKEAEEIVKKEERKKAHDSDESVIAKKDTNKVRTAEDKLKTKGKKYQSAFKQIDRSKSFTLNEALDFAIKTSVTKFDSTVELHIRLNVDPKQADQNVRGTVILPNGIGKKIRVAVFGEADDISVAKKAGADIAGTDDFLQQLDKQIINFDVLISTPSMMSRLGKYARLLGPKGLMPNPKSGTVTKDISKAVQDAKTGKVEFRVDSSGIIHVGIGKVSFGDKKLKDNLETLLLSIKQAKPSAVKGVYIQSAYLATTMGPSVRLDIANFV